MAVIAGYIQFNELGKTEYHYINQLADVFNRYKKADVQRFDCDNGAIFHYDFDAYQQASWLQTESQIATLIGHPLLSSSRCDDLKPWPIQLRSTLAYSNVKGYLAFASLIAN